MYATNNPISITVSMLATLQLYANCCSLAGVHVCMFSYCSVCSEEYVEMLAFRCRRCSDGNVAVIVVLLALTLLAALVIVRHLVSMEQAPTTGGVVVRVKNVLPVQ